MCVHATIPTSKPFRLLLRKCVVVSAVRFWVDPGLGVERAKAKNSTDASTTITAGLETSPLWAKRGRMKRLT